jgi:WD40 repeat protein
LPRRHHGVDWPGFHPFGALKGHIRTVYGVAFSADGKWVASASSASTARIWHAETGKEVLILKGHTGGVIGVAFGPDGKRLASRGDDRAVKVWKVAD